MRIPKRAATPRFTTTLAVLVLAIALGPIQPAHAQMCTFADNQDVINSIRLDGFPDDIDVNDPGECCTECENAPGCIYAEFRNGNACRLLQGGEIIRSPNDNDERALVQPVDDNTDVDIVLCARESSDISCPIGTVMQFESIFFGRDDPDTCEDEIVPDPVCSSLEAADVVRQTCEGLLSCILEARSSQLGGDPCDGTNKFLRLRYRCIRETPAPTTTTTTAQATTTTQRTEMTTEVDVPATPAPSPAANRTEGGAQVTPTQPVNNGDGGALVDSPNSAGATGEEMPIWLWVAIVAGGLVCCCVAVVAGWRIRTSLRKREDARLNSQDPYARTGFERV